MGDGRLFIAAMGLVPKKSLSRTVRRLAQVRSQMAIRRFAARYGANIEEAEKPIEAYASILDFFTRKLKPGLRPLSPDADALLCPVDGAAAESGRIESGRLIQAKGRQYTLAALLADADRAAHYEGGSFSTLYLSPKDYHRVHSPATGRIVGSTYIPGALYPVNPAAVAHVDQLFSTNERLIIHIESDRFGRIEYVMVGATCVGHMTVEFDPEIVTNVGGHSVETKHYEPPKPIERGAELGMFQMGSTVILVLEPGVVLDPLAPGSAVRMGSRLGGRSTEGGPTTGSA